VDAVSLKLARNYTNEKLNSLPSNAPTETISFDNGIYSVGNNVVNGQVSAILKGNTWTNRAGIGDTSPQTIENLDSAKTYLLIKTDGGTVNVDAVDTAVPAKITGKTSTVLTWASGKIALYELSTAEAALTEAQLGARYHYVSGTKSTIGALRIKSVGRNIFDGEYEAGTFNAHGVASVNETRIRTKNFVKVKPNTKYTLVNEENRTIAWAFYYDVNKNMINYFSTNIVTPSNCVYIRWSYLDTTDVDIKTHLVEGDGIIPYEPYKESIVNVNLPEPLRSVPSGVKDEINVITGVKTQRVGNKTNVASGTVIDYSDMTTGGQFVAYASDGTSQVGVKGDTLTITATTLIYQLAEPIITKLPAQPPLQVYENGTIYIEPVGDPSESTLPTVELTVPIGAPNKFGVATHDYGGAAADWILTKNEANCGILIVTNAGGAANIIVPNNPGRFFFVKNDSGYDVVVKSAGAEAGTTIADGNSVIVFNTGN
jgi:hypothetical protein